MARLPRGVALTVGIVALEGLPSLVGLVAVEIFLRLNFPVYPFGPF